jgi:hypothetical protein
VGGGRAVGERRSRGGGCGSGGCYGGGCGCGGGGSVTMGEGDGEGLNEGLDSYLDLDQVMDVVLSHGGEVMGGVMGQIPEEAYNVLFDYGGGGDVEEYGGAQIGPEVGCTDSR